MNKGFSPESDGIGKTKKCDEFCKFFPEMFADSKKSSTFASLSGRKTSKKQNITKWWL
jgi:hypothetical protein